MIKFKAMCIVRKEINKFKRQGLLNLQLNDNIKKENEI